MFATTCLFQHQLFAQPADFALQPCLKKRQCTTSTTKKPKKTTRTKNKTQHTTFKKRKDATTTTKEKKSPNSE
jgi:hypothetical protein